jgi:hypothetical protein
VGEHKLWLSTKYFYIIYPSRSIVNIITSQITKNSVCDDTDGPATGEDKSTPPPPSLSPGFAVKSGKL